MSNNWTQGPSWHKCYLIAHIDPRSLQITHIGTYSETPWQMTRSFDPGREILAILMETTGESYHEASEAMREIYPVTEKILSEKFPLEDFERSFGVGICTR